MKILKQLILMSLLAISVTGCTKIETMGGGEAHTLKSFLKDSEKPAVLKFYADWCVTCKAYAPDFEKVKNELASDVDFYSINIDDASSKALVKEFKIAHIPVTAFVSKDRASITKQFAPISYANLKKKVNELKSL